jgi:hypothetical protein
MPDKANDCWLQIAKVARTASQYQTASAAVLRARYMCSRTARPLAPLFVHADNKHVISSTNQQSLKFHLESAKLRWAQGEHHQALVQLQKVTAAAEIPKKSSNPRARGEVEPG